MFSNVTPREFYEGNGVLTIFDYSFDLFQNDATTVQVFYTDSDSLTIQLTYNVDFTVNVGTKKVTLTSIVPADNEFIYITRSTPAVQTWDPTGVKYLDLLIFSGIVDRLTAISQENKVETDNIVKVKKGSTDDTIEIVGAELRVENDMLVFDANGDLIPKAISELEELASLLTIVQNAAISTAADRVQTGLDAISTAADRVQTGLDAAASYLYLTSATGISDWISTKTYTKNMMCIHNEIVYYAKSISGNLNQEPPNATYWAIPFTDSINTHNHNSRNSLIVETKIGRAFSYPKLARQYGLTYEKLNSKTDLTVGDGPQGVLITGGYLWVANYSGNTVSKIDLDTYTTLATISIPGGPSSLATDGTYVWVGCMDSGNIYTINIETNATANRLNANQPQTLVFDGSYMWSGDFSGQKIYKINISTFAVTSTINLAGICMDFIFDGTYIWAIDVINMLLVKINPTTATIITSYLVSADGYVTFDGEYVWFTSGTNICKFNIVTGTVVATVPMGITGCTKLDFDGNKIYIVDNTTQLKTLNISTNAIVDTIITGTHTSNPPSGIAFDGIYVYVSNYENDNISRIKIY
jgi:hypothetical protein